MYFVAVDITLKSRFVMTDLRGLNELYKMFRVQLFKSDFLL